MTADPSDPDYRFNLAVALYKSGDNAGAAQQLREELQRRPNDSEAKSLLEKINRGIMRLLLRSSGTRILDMLTVSGHVFPWNASSAITMKRRTASLKLRSTS